MALFSGDGILFLLRWLHFLAGITWIGMLYYFNFVQTPFFAKAEAPVRTGMITGGLVATALWWFRWGAMITFLTGWLYILHIIFSRYGGIGPFFDTSYGWAIFYGGILGTTMWANVWFVIWPAQQVVMASAAQVARGGQAIPEAAARGARGGVASRTNTMLSIPMLFFMGAASHLPLFAQTTPGAKVAALILLAAAVVAAEVNALVGPATPDKAGAGKKMLSTLKGTFWAGFILAAILYFGLEIIFP
ncbi:MAG TPA: urate hydroxylase PuuD [Candidatus Tectomicrobia bacterium]|nr:urate hydroxylase PuuD [Candidatus Tectomicrobia bacterium]